MFEPTLFNGSTTLVFLAAIGALAVLGPRIVAALDQWIGGDR